jgi:cytochrome c oxidase subunit 2
MTSKLKLVGKAMIVTGTLLFLASIVLAHLPANGQEKHLTLIAKKFQYLPNIIRVNRGDRVTIRLLSEDVHHGFYLDGYEVKTSAIPGQDGVVSFVADKTGKFAFRCSVTCGSFHPYMVGYLKVEPDYRFLGAVGAMVSIFGLTLSLIGPRR